MKVAIVHEWLINHAGSEKVVEQILKCYPEADLFALVDFLPPTEREFIMNKPVQTSFIQHLPMARKKYRAYLPLMPLAVEQFDLSSYDLVLSSSHAVSKGVLTGPDQLHISYVHSPIRYAWDLQHQYLRESGLVSGFKAMLARALLHRIRLWDVRTANGVDHFLANSHFIARRIHKTYRRSANVLYPPVDVDGFALQETKADYYLSASRMVPYKKMDLIVKAFSQMPDKQLVVIGDGPDFDKVANIAGPNVKMLGYQSFAALKQHMQNARAFVFAAEEDFGITPVEAQASGTPVIAFGKGGALETVRPLGVDRPTGVLFPEQSIASIQHAIRTFEAANKEITAKNCRQNALRFSEEAFRHGLTAFVEASYAAFCKAKAIDYGDTEGALQHRSPVKEVGEA
jgi:glycosyltransferase involved in cell wall biosynthesis